MRAVGILPVNVFEWFKALSFPGALFFLSREFGWRALRSAISFRLTTSRYVRSSRVSRNCWERACRAPRSQIRRRDFSGRSRNRNGWIRSRTFSRFPELSSTCLMFRVRQWWSVLRTAGISQPRFVFFYVRCHPPMLSFVYCVFLFLFLSRIVFPVVHVSQVSSLLLPSFMIY